MPSKTPTKPSRRRNAAGPHLVCSKKRSALKERIRTLDKLVDELEASIRLQELRVDILNDVLRTVVETMGLELVLDPFGSGLTHDEGLEGKSTNKPPS